MTVKQGARSGAAVVPGVLFGLLLIGLGILWLKVLEEEEEAPESAGSPSPR